MDSDREMQNMLQILYLVIFFHLFSSRHFLLGNVQYLQRKNDHKMLVATLLRHQGAEGERAKVTVTVL